MRTFVFKYIFIIIAFVVAVIISPNVQSQELDYGDVPPATQVLAIIPIQPYTYSIYNDNLNYVSGVLANDLRQIPGIQTLNTLQSMRTLKRRENVKYFDSLKKSYNDGQFPDPDDLLKIAYLLDADKIVLVTGGFDTQEHLLHRGFKSQLNRFNKIIIKPTYIYNVYISMFDPVTGTMEWSTEYHKDFLLRDFYISAENMSSNPSFLRLFGKFTSVMSVKTRESLQEHFYQVQMSTVSTKILSAPANKVEATEGAVTTDGHFNSKPQVSPDSIMPPEPMPVIKKEPKPFVSPSIKPIINPVSTSENSNNSTETTLNTPYDANVDEQPASVENNNRSEPQLETLKPEYEADLLEKHQQNIMNKY